MSEAKRPKGVPAEAVFNRKDEQWELGKRDKKGRPVGEWRYWWGATGHLCCVSQWEDGRKEVYTRFHPDGTWSRKGIEVDGKPAPGEIIHYQKSKKPTTELSLIEPEYKKVFRVEETYIRKGLSKWKNFDAKDRRIELDGTVIPQLAPDAYAKNFRPFAMPELLARLVEFQNDVGVEMFAEGFALQVDDKGLLKGFSGADGKPLVAKRKEQAFLAAFLPIASANGTGSVYCAWTGTGAKDVTEMPVVIFGDEAGVHVVAQNLSELLQIVAADVEPMVEANEVSFFASPDHEPSPEIDAFRKWLKRTLGAAPAKKPDDVVRKAQKRYGAAFAKWLDGAR